MTYGTRGITRNDACEIHERENATTMNMKHIRCPRIPQYCVEVDAVFLTRRVSRDSNT